VALVGGRALAGRDDRTSGLKGIRVPRLCTTSDALTFSDENNLRPRMDTLWCLAAGRLTLPEAGKAIRTGDPARCMAKGN
jgi:hypothetical protein